MSDAAWTWALAAALASIASYVGVRLVERYATALGVIDLPNVRSSHKAPRPRGGGLGIVVAVVVTIGAIAALIGPIGRDVMVLLAAAVVLAALGFWDDLRSLPVGFRLLVQTAVAAFVVAELGGIDRLPLPRPADIPLGWTGATLTVVWLVGVLNFFNFMDGVDGFAAGQAVITLWLLAWALWPQPTAGLAFITAAASVAFLLRNWWPARIFLGDVGSAFLGFLLGALPLSAPLPARPQVLLLVAISLTLFLLDPVATLLLRAGRGAKLGASHRDHAYQQLIPIGSPHGPMVTVLLVAGLTLALVAGAGYLRSTLAWPAVIIAVLAFAIEWRAASRRRL